MSRVLGELRQLRRELGTELQRGEVAPQRLDGRGAAENDVRPRLRENSGERERVGAGVRAFRQLCQRPDVATRGQPSVGKRLLDDHADAGRLRSLERGAGRSLEQVPGRLHRVEAPDLESALDRFALVRPGDGQPDRQARLAQSGQLVEQRPVFQNPTLRRGRVDLVETKVFAEQPAALRELTPQGGEREVLDLVHLGVDAPAGGVGVSPLGTDGHRPGREPAALEPRSEELLRLAVRASSVEVPDAAGIRGVENRVGLALEGGDVPFRTEIVAVTDVDVPGPAQRGEAEPQSADRETRPTQDVVAQLRRTKSIATGTPASSRSEEHTSELQSRLHLVCRLLLEKKKITSENSSSQVRSTLDRK